jgi:nucleotide-binding universal stress UspA family protein
VLHVCAVDAGRVRVLEIWEDATEAQAYFDAHIAPALSGGEPPTAPRFDILPVHALFSALDAQRQVLIVANQTLGSRQLSEAIDARIASAPCHLHVVVPATLATPLPTVDPYEMGMVDLSSAIDTATDRARKALYAELERLRQMGVRASGEIGDPDPFEAIQQALHREGFDEVILSTLPAGASRWLHMDLPSRIRRITTVPVTVVTAPRRAESV